MITIVSYNVENLFDLKKSGYEYTEYIPNTNAKWNQKNFNIKIKNIARVIKDINADIIALQEIESQEALSALRYRLKRDGLYYQYVTIADAKDTVVKVAILSKYKIIYTKEIPINGTYRYRNILETKIDIDGHMIYLLNNHWKSKDGKESERILCAKKLYNRVKEIGFDKNIVIAGDFNSDYEEYIKMDKRHNDTNSITGINHILKTNILTTKANNTLICKECLYNLWYDIDITQRYSYIYKHKKEALDSIILTMPLLDDQNFYYLKGSIKSYKEDYLYKNNKPYRWQMSKRKPKEHIGRGYSDHLPIMATFIIKE